MSKTITQTHYNILSEINSIFINNNFKSKIGAKTTPNSLEQKIIYYNPINGTENYTLKIQNMGQVQINFPIKNSNFFYTTTHDSIEKTLNHINFLFENK